MVECIPTTCFKGVIIIASRYEKKDSKKRILSACVRLFLEKGYCKTTAAEILKEAGVTPSTFYNIYKTKSSVLTDLTEFMFENQFNIAEQIVGNTEKPTLLYAVETSVQLTLAELNENLREIYVEAYTQPDSIRIINEKTAVKLQHIFGTYLPDFNESDFYEMEIGTSAFMRGFMAQKCDMYFTLERKLARFLSMSLNLFEVPKEEQQEILNYIAKLNIREIAWKVMQGLFAALSMKFDFSIEKLTSYDDGYNLYRMDIKYDYKLDHIINYGIKDDQTMIEAITKEALPYFPIKIKAPHFGCTAFTMTGADGSVRMGRNYDFKNNTSAMLVYCTPKDGYKSVAFAALDNISANAPEENIKKKLETLTTPFICLDGMNEKGVSIAVLTLDSEPTHQNSGKPTISTTLAIRLVLDRAATTEEAVNLLRDYDMFASSGRDYHFYITDASGDGRVIEYDCNSKTRQLVATPSEAVTNFFILYQDAVLPNQKNGIYGHGKERYDAVMNVINQNKGTATNDTAWTAIKASAQDVNPFDITSNTQWSIVYHNTDLTAQIVIRRHWDDITNYDLNTNTIQNRLYDFRSEGALQ